jgi:hypothetical protein
MAASPACLLETCCVGRAYALSTHEGTSAYAAAGGYDLRYAVGERPKKRVKLVVNDPRLLSPTAKQISVIGRSV